MAQLQLFVLGPPRLEREGQPIELNLRKALALLVYLAVSGQPQSRDALATMLWPESDGREGRTRLRRTLHRLNETIGDDILDSGPEIIRLNSHADLWLDSAAFRQHVVTATQNLLAPERLACLNAAAELYSEDFLAGFTLPDSPAFDEWQFFQRESLHQLYGQVLEELVQAYRRQHDWAQAIAYARRWLALDGLHEPAHRMLMQLYAWAGQHAAALRQYQECARILDAELGVAPEDETTALYEAIRTRQLTPLELPDREPGPAPEMLAAEPSKRYVLEERLAEAGQSEVYRARDQLTGQFVAIKWLKTELADRHLDLVARFVREGAALRRLNHPNIVGILETFEQAGRYAIVMEYVPGGSLREMLDRAGQLPLEWVLAIGLELADALSRAHHLGIIHRDLKPENVLLAGDGTPRLSDFGMARLEWEDARLTQSGTLLGSPAYMSPEAVHGEELDGRSDIWSLGVLLYELLAGRRPFEGVQITPVLAAIQADPVPDLREFRPDAPPALVDLLGRMLLKQRARRLPSMRQVAAELEAIGAGRTAEGQESQRCLPHALASSEPGASPRPQPGIPFVSHHTEQPIRFGTSRDRVRLTSVPAEQEQSSRRADLETPRKLAALEPMAVTPTWQAAHNLPAQPTPFIGRTRELADIQRLLDDPTCRLFTLVGPGGIGKTRLALETASAALEAFPEGVYFVPLAPLTSADHLVPALADSLDLRFYEGSDPQQQLLNYLREKQLLLVLDNFEHVLEGAALVADILAAAPRVKLLVTSRERLNLGGEAIYRLGGMAFPDQESHQRALEYGAVQLLMQRARQARPDQDLRAYNLDAMVRICRLVQGMPLAIVLAAGWLEVLSFEEIADEIARSLDFLESQARDLPERQRSVRATFDYSWKRLAVEDQRAFMRLSVFRGEFTRLAAQAVAGADVRTLRTLVHTSFLSVGQGDRYEIHELLRQYAEEHLEATGAAERVHDRHLAYFLDLTEAMVSDLRGPHQKEALDRLEQEHDNLRAALRWALDTQPAESSLRLAGALWWLWDRRGHFSEGRQWLEAALQLPWEAAGTRDVGDSSDLDRLRRARAKALMGAGVFAWYQTDYARACACLEESAIIAEEAKDAWCQAYALCRLVRVFIRLGDRPRARALAEQSLVIFRGLGDTWGVSMPLRDLGWIALAEGDLPTARALLEESLALRREMQDWTDIADGLLFVGDFHWVSGDYEQAAAFLAEALALSRELHDKLGMASALGRLGFATLAQGKVGRAAELFREGLRLRYELGARDGVAENLAGLAGVAVAQGDDEQAAWLIGALEAFFLPLEGFLAWIHLPWHERTVAEARAALGEERFAVVRAAAQTLPLEQVIAEALAEDTGVLPLPALRMQ